MQLVQLFGVDRAVLFAVLTKVWSAAAGLITLALVSLELTPVQQGYYYTFCSLISLQILGELGISLAIPHLSSHEMVLLSWNSNGTVSGDPLAKGRLQSLIFFSVRWISLSSFLMAALLLTFGWSFFKHANSEELSTVNIQTSWMMLVVATALNTILAVILALLEGSGKVEDVAVIRFSQSVSSALTIWLILILDGNLFALSISAMVSAALGFLLLWLKFHGFFRDIYCCEFSSPGINWKHEVWPFQWRMAISSLSGFLIFQLLNPILLVTTGPIAAGQIGMTTQIVAAITGIANVWVTTKVSIYGRLIAERKISELDELFLRGFLQSFAVLILGFIGALCFVILLGFNSSSYMDRVLPPHLFALMLLAGIANHIVSSEAVYLRAHRQEPFMLLSVLQGVVTALTAVLLIPKFGLMGAVLTHVMPALCIGLIMGTIIFVKSRSDLA